MSKYIFMKLLAPFSSSGMVAVPAETVHMKYIQRSSGAADSSAPNASKPAVLEVLRTEPDTYSSTPSLETSVLLMLRIFAVTIGTSIAKLKPSDGIYFCR